MSATVPRVGPLPWHVSALRTVPNRIPLTTSLFTSRATATQVSGTYSNSGGPATRREIRLRNFLRLHRRK